MLAVSDKPVEQRRRMIWGLITLVAAASSVFVCTATAGAALTTQHVDFSGVFFDQCSGELLDVTGTLTQVSDTFTDPSGTLHTLSHFAQTGSALGETTGSRYRFVAVQASAEIDLSLVDAMRTLTSTLAVIGQGSVTHERAHTTFHFTEIDGQLIVVVSDISFDCT
jgi:hypothetical protein